MEGSWGLGFVLGGLAKFVGVGYHIRNRFCCLLGLGFLWEFGLGVLEGFLSSL